jgi:uncharacterized repeat protein (TIGR02543 family)
VNTVGSGSVITEPVKPTYHYGDVVTFTAQPALGWTFAGWSGDLDGTAIRATRVITGDTVITATFTPGTYTLAVYIVGQGRVDKDPDRAAYLYGDVVTLTAEADPGWTFDGWSGDLSGTGSCKTITMTHNTTVTATFTTHHIFLPLITNRHAQGLVLQTITGSPAHVVGGTVADEPGAGLVGIRPRRETIRLPGG